MDLSSVVSVKIHPAIGVARVGDSDEYLVGPELPYPVAPPAGGYKDAQGRLKRQAARFRVYGYDADRNVVGEITAADAAIDWTVHVANKKSAWYDFRFALDLFPVDSPSAMGEVAARRNASITGPARELLAIDPGPRTVGGANAAPQAFDSGTFFGNEVYLGEVRTDGAGRLIFLGGRGVSGSLYGHQDPITFANNAGWHDDISDGPVHATVRIGDRAFEADSAWVVTAPPNYAPDIVSPQTMWDLIYDTNAGWWFNPPETPSFTEHILPLFRQLSETQWVNYGFFVRHGWGAPYDFSNPELLRKLAQPKAADGSDPHAELRTQIFYSFRQPSSTQQPLAWPPVYGDASGSFDDSPRAFFTYTNTNLGYLAAWRKGDFIGDWDLHPPAPPQTIESVPLADQPGTLDRAALHWCMGGPFHPGCEMTWTMRQGMLYRGKLRLRERPAGLPEPDYGAFMTPALAVADDGPLASSGPGDISKWMAVPWQTDTASCRSGYPADVYPDPWLPTFWPSRVPNHVLTQRRFEIVTDAKRPIEERVAAFNTRVNWLRGLNLDAPYIEQISKMIHHFGELGVVERRDNPNANDPFPTTFYVESRPTVPVADDVLDAAQDARGGEGVSEDFMRARFGGRARLGSRARGNAAPRA